MEALDRGTQVIGLVLAGGRSRRMGRDKGSIQIEGTSLLDLARRRLASVVPEVLVAARREGDGLVMDGPGRGPAAGLLGAAAHRPGCALLVLACDLPWAGLPLLRALLSESGVDWAVPRWRGRLEPLCALYGPEALVALERRVAAGDFSLRGLAREETLRVRYLEDRELKRLGDPSRLFFNVNTPEDLHQLGERRGSLPRPRD